MGAIFISYRRDDAKHAAGRLVDRLGRTFHSSQLFLDIDNLAPGIDFVKELSRQVHQCDVLLAVIGPGWIESRDKTGARRIDNPKDFVRIEIEAALARDIRVIPVLVDGATMPSEADLPPSLQPMSTRNGVRLVHERFAADAEDLTRALTKVVTPNRWGLARVLKTKRDDAPAKPASSQQATAAVSDFPTAPTAPLLESIWGPPFIMAALGVVSGMVSVVLPGSKPDMIFWYHDGAPLAGFWFGSVIAFGCRRWGRVPMIVVPLLLITTHIAWQLSILGGAGGVAGPFGWGAFGALLTWVGAALVSPPMRNLKWAAACTGVGAVALYVAAALNLFVDTKGGGVQDASQLLTNGYSFWQASVGAVFGLFWSLQASRQRTLPPPLPDALDRRDLDANASG